MSPYHQLVTIASLLQPNCWSFDAVLGSFLLEGNLPNKKYERISQSNDCRAPTHPLQYFNRICFNYACSTLVNSFVLISIDLHCYILDYQPSHPKKNISGGFVRFPHHNMPKLSPDVLKSGSNWFSWPWLVKGMVGMAKTCKTNHNIS